MINGTLTSSVTTLESSTRCSRAAFKVGTGSSTFDSATVIIQAREDGQGDWFPVSDASWTSDKTGVIEVSQRWALRFSISGGSGSESVPVSLLKIEK